MKKKIVLSVAIATYNEEENVARCLRAVKGWVDEIVVVDGSSQDRTREIARKFGARVYKTTNKPIFHINKQMAIDKCRGDWVLQLDADEIVSPALKKEIEQIISKNKNGPEVSSIPVAYWIPRRNFFLGRWLKKTGQYPDPVIRFFRRGRAHLPCQDVHEQMVVDGPVGWLQGHLWHYPYPTFAEYLKKSNRYTSLTAQEWRVQKKKPGLKMLLWAIWQSIRTFFLLFFRHKGFRDSFPGFVFSFYSGLHYLTAYVKFWELYYQKRNINLKKDWE